MRGDDKSCFRRIKPKLFGTSSFRQSIVHAMYTANSRYQGAYPTHFTAEPALINSIIEMKRNKDHYILTKQQSNDTV